MPAAARTSRSRCGFLPPREEQGKEPVRKCVATIAGHHPRAVYSLGWGQGGLVTVGLMTLSGCSGRRERSG